MVPRQSMLGEILHGDPLTQREIEALYAAAMGETAADTGRRMFLSPETVREHRKRAIAKLGVRNTTAAVAAALRTGLIE